MTRQEQLLRYRNRYENGRHMGGFPGDTQKEQTSMPYFAGYLLRTVIVAFVLLVMVFWHQTSKTSCNAFFQQFQPVVSEHTTLYDAYVAYFEK